MRFGIFSNSRRPDRDQADIWDRDLFEIQVADRLGFHEAWISEHDSPAELIICKAAGMTEAIKLGSAVRPLPYHHPLQVAIEANACDNLTHGRYMLGAGFGFYAAHMERRGLDYGKAREMMHASLELMLKLWHAEEPIDYDGPFWSGKNVWIKPRPVQKPHPPISFAVNNTVSTAQLAGKHDFGLLTSDFISGGRIRKFGDALIASMKAAGHKPSRKKLGVCRVIYVAETDEKAREEMRDTYEKTIAWEKLNTPHHQVERIPKGGTMDDVTYDYLVDSGNLFIGSPDTVHDRIMDFYRETGGFGLLMFHGGRDYATQAKLERSMEMFAEEVAPRLKDVHPDNDAWTLETGGGADADEPDVKTHDLAHYTPPV